jgi:hypothetical protein
MLRFCGFDLELLVDEVLDPGEAVVRSASDSTGERWLIVQVDRDPDHLVWVCAPISSRALHAVTSGRASARDAVRHSATGTVEVVTIDHGRAVPDRCLCCAAIPADVLPPAPNELLLAC